MGEGEIKGQAWSKRGRDVTKPATKDEETPRSGSEQTAFVVQWDVPSVKFVHLSGVQLFFCELMRA